MVSLGYRHVVWAVCADQTRPRMHLHTCVSLFFSRSKSTFGCGWERLMPFDGPTQLSRDAHRFVALLWHRPSPPLRLPSALLPPLDSHRGAACVISVPYIARRDFCSERQRSRSRLDRPANANLARRRRVAQSGQPAVATPAREPESQANSSRLARSLCRAQARLLEGFPAEISLQGGGVVVEQRQAGLGEC